MLLVVCWTLLDNFRNSLEFVFDGMRNLTFFYARFTIVVQRFVWDFFYELKLYKVKKIWSLIWYTYMFSRYGIFFLNYSEIDVLNDIKTNIQIKQKIMVPSKSLKIFNMNWYCKDFDGIVIFCLIWIFV